MLEEIEGFKNNKLRIHISQQRQREAVSIETGIMHIKSLKTCVRQIMNTFNVCCIDRREATAAGEVRNRSKEIAVYFSQLSTE